MLKNILIVYFLFLGFSTYSQMDDDYYSPSKTYIGTYIKPFRGILLGASYERRINLKTAINIKLGLVNRDFYYETRYYFKFIDTLYQVNGFQKTQIDLFPRPGLFVSISPKFYFTEISEKGNWYFSPGYSYKFCNARSQAFNYYGDFKTFSHELYFKMGNFYQVRGKFFIDFYAGLGLRYIIQHDHPQYQYGQNFVDLGQITRKLFWVSPSLGLSFYWRHDPKIIAKPSDFRKKIN